ncbi:DoxX family protein [Hymenobacter sp. HSC-4F20]|uniref:DoxX family protein n=1 Tax=Hymenobacter sp. HSC-4F20 TaxID=2864135 RepID=UPI001C731788|nr:DoxX family protein [Hymenobacter sp. HSC-4F20]MBX0289922.1 DoxX family protein [Hymenobacter sp. HSC-4F20]
MAPFFLSPWAGRLLSVLRIVSGLLMLFHGSQKLFGWPPSDHGGGNATGLMLVAGILEFGGGLLLLIGLFTRPVAFILSGLMAVAYFMAHAPQHALPIVNQGELAVLYCFVYLYLAAAGAGPWSVDAARSRNTGQVVS